jgi:hypothetical protein
MLLLLSQISCFNFFLFFVKGRKAQEAELHLSGRYIFTSTGIIFYRKDITRKMKNVIRSAPHQDPPEEEEGPWKNEAS